MSIAQSVPTQATPASSAVPSHETATEHAPFAPDADMIARMANAFFQVQPHQAPAAPVSPGVPVVPPTAPEVPAPSVVTTVAPFTPARTPFGPPDIPPTTIPSVVPTPNVAPPAPPTYAQPGTRPLGAPDVPQPGASIGAAQAEAPVGADHGAPQNIFSAALAQSWPSPVIAPNDLAVDQRGLPGGAPQATDNLYFLQSVSAPPVRSSSDAAYAPPAQPKVAAPAAYEQTPEGYAISGPSEADPHRFSDTASAATPNFPVEPPHPEPGATPGAAGPAASDALYFATHDGGHAGVSERLPAAPKQHDAPQQGYAPSVEAASAQPTRQLFDPYRVKKDFPILQQQVHGKPLIWLDNAATTQKPQAVIDRLSHFYEYENSNIHRAAHALAARSTDAYESAREKVRRFLRAPSVKNIIFVRGATEGINLVAQAWGRRNVGAGDEIVVSHLEHHANIVPWQMLCAEKGARLRVAPVDDRGQIILEEYEKLLNPRTKIVAFTQVSNALGTVTPAKEMTAMAHRHGACVLVDGAQSVSHMAVDVQDIDCDFFIFSGHKVFGPTGIGAVYGKDAVLAHMPPWQGGGNMIADVTFEKTIYQGPPERFEAGTGNIADAVGLGAALDYVEQIGMEVIARYEHDLLVYATEKMRLVPGLTFIGTAAEKASVLSFVLDGHETISVGKALDREGIAVRAGHHCAQPILRRFGLEATVRPSLAFYNTCSDVDALVAALLRLQSGRGGR